MKNLFKFHGIEYQRTCVYTPHQNGVVERKHRHILTVAWALLFQSCLLLHFWGECILTAVYLINRLPSPLISKKTPFEMLYSRPPSLNHLKVFGCLSYATVVHPIHKFESRAKRCIFVGYSTGRNGYKLWFRNKTILCDSWCQVPWNHFSFLLHVNSFNSDFTMPNSLPIRQKHGWTCYFYLQTLVLTILIHMPKLIQMNSSLPICLLQPQRKLKPYYNFQTRQIFPLNQILHPSQSTRPKQPPTWHRDFLMTSQSNQFTSTQSSITGTRYPFTNIVSSSHFSPSHSTIYLLQQITLNPNLMFNLSLIQIGNKQWIQN